jgi:glutathione synthase/RimK-type ligase-like ATP-grasp enzyme
MTKTISPGEDTLGVITCYRSRKHLPFAQAEYLKELAQEGKKIGMHVMVFDPKEVNWNTRTTPSWFIDHHDQWRNGVKKLPPLLYDRCSYPNSRHYMSYKPHLLRFMQDPHIRLLGKGLSGKWPTYEILRKSSDIQPFLPLTIKYRSPEDVIHFIEKYESALIKPNGGSAGRGVVAISKKEKEFLAQGRSISNQTMQKTISTKAQLKSWLQQFIGKTRYLIQSYLILTTPDQHPFDIRVLTQKNEEKEWQTTGMAVRTGQPNFITANLHGGGQAKLLHPFLQENYPKYLVSSILDHIETISQLVPPFIEKHHGSLVELGIDIGVDRQGKAWILEVNSKPGRTIFSKTGELDIRKRSVQLPIYYARALLTEHGGG